MQKHILSRTLVLALIVLLAVTGCGKKAIVPVENQDESSGNYYTNELYKLSFSLPEDWKADEEKDKDGTLTVRLAGGLNGGNILIVTVIPGKMSDEELIQSGRILLEKSLYEVKRVSAYQGEPGGRKVQFIAAEAGGKENVLARTAAFSEQDKSYFFTLLSRENVNASEQLLESIMEKVQTDT